MKKQLLLSLVSLPILVVLDLGWSSGIANSFYRAELGSLFTTHILIVPVILFYLIYAFALGYFVLVPAMTHRSWSKLLFGAALLGLTAYGTYDLVNLGTTANWPTLMSIVDIIWGMVLTSATASIVYLLATKVFHWY